MFYSVTSDEKIRVAIMTRLAERDETQTAVAKRLGVTLQTVNDVVRRKSAKLPTSLVGILDALDLELKAVPKEPHA